MKTNNFVAVVAVAILGFLSAQLGLSAEPLLSVPVSVDNGQQARIDIHDLNRIPETVAQFAQTHGLPNDVVQPLVNEVVSRAQRAGIGQAQAPATQAPKEEYSVDVQITVPFTYQAGTDIRVTAERFIERHGLQNSAELQNSLIQALSNKLSQDAAAAEKQNQQQQQQAQEKKPLYVVPLNIGNQQVSVELYDGDRIDTVAANVCKQLNLSDKLYQPIVQHLTAEVKKQTQQG